MTKAISIIGLGKLGLPLAASFAVRGIRVWGVDCNASVVDAVNYKTPHVYEPGLRDAMVEAGSNLVAIRSVDQAVVETDLTIVLVPTPSERDGRFSLLYVLDVCKDLGHAIARWSTGRHVVVISSTVMPGSCEGAITKALESASGRTVGDERLGLAYCPEFVALGNALEGFQRPDFVMIGASDVETARTVRALYKRFCTNNPPIVDMRLVNAEIAKISLNFFVTAKITVANVLAEICEGISGADVDVVTNAIGLDSRIGRKYLKGATAFGGTCFPRDVRALAALARTTGAYGGLPQVIEQVNNHVTIRIARIVERASSLYGDNSVGILGLSFKPRTDVVEESTGMALVELLSHLDRVETYDERVPHRSTAATAQALVTGVNVVVVTIPDDEYAKLVFKPGQTVIDCWRCLDPVYVRGCGATYISIGRGE